MCTDIGDELDRLNGRPLPRRDTEESAAEMPPRGPDLVHGEPVDTSEADIPPATSTAGGTSAHGTVVVLPKVVRLGGAARGTALFATGLALLVGGTRYARRITAQRTGR